MQVHERRLPRTLGKPVGHPQGARLLERQDVPEVLGEVLQERQLRRARVAEDARHPKVPQKIEGDLAPRRYISLPPCRAPYTCEEYTEELSACPR